MLLRKRERKKYYYHDYYHYYYFYYYYYSIISKPQDDIAHVELKSVSGGATIFTKSIFVRFNDLDLR